MTIKPTGPEDAATVFAFLLWQRKGDDRVVFGGRHIDEVIAAVGRLLDLSEDDLEWIKQSEVFGGPV